MNQPIPDPLPELTDYHDRRVEAAHSVRWLGIVLAVLITLGIGGTGATIYYGANGRTAKQSDVKTTQQQGRDNFDLLTQLCQQVQQLAAKLHADITPCIIPAPAVSRP